MSVTHSGLCFALWLSGLNIPADHEKVSVSFFLVATSLLTHVATLLFIPDITPFTEQRCSVRAFRWDMLPSCWGLEALVIERRGREEVVGGYICKATSAELESDSSWKNDAEKRERCADTHRQRGRADGKKRWRDVWKATVSLCLRCVPVWPKYGMPLTRSPLAHPLWHTVPANAMTKHGVRNARVVRFSWSLVVAF